MAPFRYQDRKLDQAALVLRWPNMMCLALVLIPEHDASDGLGLVYLRPMSCFDDVKSSISGLRSQMLGDADMKVRI
jgi:hypothetical protein